MNAASAPPEGRAHPAGGSRSRRVVQQTLLGAAGVAGLLLLWQLLPTTGLVNPAHFPEATSVLARFGTDLLDLEFWRNVGRTLASWGIGLLVSTVAALVAGTVVGMVPFLRRATHTLVEFLRPIPSVALIPLAVLSFGITMEAALVIIVFASFWQVFVQVLYGVADIDAVARDTARSYGLGRRAQLLRLVLPTALPYLVTGLRLAASVALILAVTAEMTIGNPGLGNALMLSYSNGDQAGVFAVVIATGLIGLVVNLIFGAVERRALFWHQSVRSEDSA
ncbi:ABC transporter permease [Leucobacter allii]|uniref:ABC transporter permease n=1 Tax=Leucobacter allii TaxID=2932247 RepID=UPI001FD3B618|nr:ABC transporter permease [Leucobacter allii]UOR01932.1 ABC transporter permease [Leucobacter allii]